MRIFQGTLMPPCVYQGSKQRFVETISNIIEENEIAGGEKFVFYDLCCGSGCISLEMVCRGYPVIMVDKGEFGKVWEAIGKQEFSLVELRNEIDKIPSIEKMQGYFTNLSKQEIDKEKQVYQYLLLQAATFGGKQIWIQDGKWKNASFRGYWHPTETSNRRSTINPMMPMPETIYKRMEDIVKIASKHMTGYNIDIFEAVEIIKRDKRRKVIYIDPPYKNTTGYVGKFDIFEVIEELKGEHLYISESFGFTGIEGCTVKKLADSRKKGNISGNLKNGGIDEVLNIIAPIEEKSTEDKIRDWL